MTYDEWVEKGRPHWQCIYCERIFITIPQPEGFICPLCQDKLNEAVKAAEVSTDNANNVD